MSNIYINLATNSLRKNKNFYIPYIASSAIMVALFYILGAISTDSVIRGIHGGKTLTMILNIGLPVIALLGILFIIYMSSFIMKRRRKELGLYSVLGMEKRHIARVVFIENIIVASSSIVSGIIGGILFEKIAQLLLLKILKQKADMNFEFPVVILKDTVLLFGAIFLFILLNSLREIFFKNTLAYIREESAGEKKPKARWFLGLVGFVILGIAYYMASTVTNGAEAITRFMGAVLLVIIATYILFIVGSIVVLTIMKNSKNYYYKTNHFVSVSGMLYRMKRNGAGLASICILSTMVLVMISSVSTVFFYNNKAFDDRFNYDFGISVDPTGRKVGNEEDEDYWTNRVPVEEQDVFDEIYATADGAGVEVTDLVHYHTYDYYGMINGNTVTTNPDFSGAYYEVWMITSEDYKSINSDAVTLGDNQIGWFFMNHRYEFQSGNILFEAIGDFEGVKLPSRPAIMPGEYTSTCIDVLFVVIPESLTLQDVEARLDEAWGVTYEHSTMIEDYYAFNVSGTDVSELRYFNLYNDMYLEPIPDDLLSEYNTNAGNHDGLYRSIFSSLLFKQVFNNMYGGLFFLGILLSICCVVIAVLIMYFKQILEGYEDAKRFSIMKKVGLTNDEIRKSIYSQIVMVFLAPLIVAGIHTAFAYKLIKSLIILFGISNISGFFVILIISMALFMIFYGIVFWITSKNYLKIVNSAENAV